MGHKSLIHRNIVTHPFGYIVRKINVLNSDVFSSLRIYGFFSALDGGEKEHGTLSHPPTQYYRDRKLKM